MYMYMRRVSVSFEFYYTNIGLNCESRMDTILVLVDSNS